jgi:hypothetical protein
MGGPGERYALGPSRSRVHYGTEELEDLPEAYGTGRLMLAARDPHWVCAWWDLTSKQQQHYNQLSVTGHLALRIHLDQVSDQPLSQIEVHPESRHWFVHVGRGGARFVAELGYPSKSGPWVTLAESRPTVTPAETLAEETPEPVEFMTLPVELPKEELVTLVKQALHEHVPLVEVLHQLRAEGLLELPLPPAEAPPAEASFPAEVSFPAQASTEESWPVAAPRPGQPLAKVLSLDEKRRVWLGSLEITELVRRQRERGLSSVALEESSESPVGQPGLGGISSPLEGAGERPRGFWFNVNAELIVYGATEKDATVTIGGRAIKLRPDGSFSYRFALPDGRYELPVLAKSSDGHDARQAELQFSRETRYGGGVQAHPQDASLKPPEVEHVS